MEVKIVFSDIDGTFLTSDHKVTEKTEKAVKKLLEKNSIYISFRKNARSNISNNRKNRNKNSNNML